MTATCSSNDKIIIETKIIGNYTFTIYTDGSQLVVWTGGN